MTFTLKELWGTLLNILHLFPAGHVDSHMLDDQQNKALNELFDLVVSIYCDRVSDFEYQINQTIAKHYVKEMNSDTVVQFNINPRDSTINVLTPVQSSCKWAQLFSIEDGALICRMFKIRVLIRTDALNRCFSLDEATSKTVRSIFGSVYHGPDIASDNVITLATSTDIWCGVDELCSKQKSAVIAQISETSWLEQYLQSYRAIAQITT